MRITFLLIVCVFAIAQFGNAQTSEQTTTTASVDQTQSNLFPQSLDGGLVKLSPEENSKWIKFSNSKNASALRELHIMVYDIPVSDIDEDEELEDESADSSGLFAGVQAEVQFNKSKISNINIQLGNKELYIKAYGYASKQILEEVVKQLLTNIQ